MNDKTIRILVDVSDESIVGSWGWQGDDPAASIEKYLRLCRRELVGAFPGYAVEIEPNDHATRVSFFDLRNTIEERMTIEADQGQVLEILAHVWVSNDWRV